MARRYHPGPDPARQLRPRHRRGPRVAAGESAGPRRRLLATALIGKRNFADAAFTKGRAIEPSNLRWISGMVEVCFQRTQPGQALALLAQEAAIYASSPAFLVVW